MKSLFYTPTSKTVFNAYDKYKWMAQVGTTLNKYLVAYTDNNTPITVFQSSDLQFLLNKLKGFKDPNFETVRLVMVNALESLMVQVQLYNQYRSLVTSLDTIAQKASILDSIESILGYLKMIRSSPFPEQTVTVVAATIVPQYAEYVRRYGKPTNGIFDPVLLANIVAELQP
jgi:hypothetical protein